MPEQRSTQEQTRLLADVAEMYFLQEMSQSEIGEVVGLTRSMVSRLITEARQKKIVEIRIHRPLESDHSLETALQEQYGLQVVSVVTVRHYEGANLLKYIGGAGAVCISRFFSRNMVLGVTWGTSVCAVVDELEPDRSIHATVVQLAGSLGARQYEYDGHSIVMRTAEKLGGEAYYLDAPFFCQNAEMAKNLRENHGIRESIALGKKVKVAILGVGSTNPEFSSFYRAGTVPIEEIEGIMAKGAVGAVCGLHFNIHGQEVCGDFCDKLVGIRREDLLNVPFRIGISGGASKVEAILGALRGKYINGLVTDQITAQGVLELSRKIK
jgi:DNA-binding transcriptional regulator LsrR (DeoR family)